MRNSLSEVERRAIVEEHPASGLTVSEFCAQKAISVKSFYTWRRRFHGTISGEREAVKQPGSFIEVGGPAVGTTSCLSTPWSVELTLANGTIVRVRG